MIPALLAALLQTTTALRLETCRPADLPFAISDARCGRYEVFENRAARTGRKISLRVVVLPATGPNRAPDPVFYLAGGPGSSIVEGIRGIAFDPSGLRARRDLVLVDQRGTGGSHSLSCDFYGSSDTLQAYLGDFIPADALRRCHTELARTSDLAQYGTSNFVNDLDEVRAALGYQRINLHGGSYGTRASLEYLRRYEARVRTAILLGVVAPSLRAPRHFARDAQRSLDAVLAECAADSACARDFPALRANIQAVFNRLRQAPVSLTVLHPRTQQPQTVSLGYDMVAETLRYMLYSSRATTLIPAVMHAASKGDFEWLARRALTARGAFDQRGDFDGLYVAITCAEDLPGVDDVAEMAEAKGTFLGDYRLQQQRHACRIWPRASAPADVRPVRSDVPVLMITGALDPVTPPGAQAEAAAGLTRAARIVVPHGGHSLGGLQGLGCIDAMIRDFIESAGAPPATACLSRIRRPAFPATPPR